VTASPRGVNGLMSCISRGMAEAAVALVKAAEMDLVMQQDEEGLVRHSADIYTYMHIYAYVHMYISTCHAAAVVPNCFFQDEWKPCRLTILSAVSCVCSDVPALCGGSGGSRECECHP
jgi:hypothetical protein